MSSREERTATRVPFDWFENYWHLVPRCTLAKRFEGGPYYRSKGTSQGGGVLKTFFLVIAPNGNVSRRVKDRGKKALGPLRHLVPSVPPGKTCFYQA